MENQTKEVPQIELSDDLKQSLDTAMHNLIANAECCLSRIMLEATHEITRQIISQQGQAIRTLNTHEPGESEKP